MRKTTPLLPLLPIFIGFIFITLPSFTFAQTKPSTQPTTQPSTQPTTHPIPPTLSPAPSLAPPLKREQKEPALPKQIVPSAPSIQRVGFQTLTRFLPMRSLAAFLVPNGQTAIHHIKKQFLEAGQKQTWNQEASHLGRIIARSLQLQQVPTTNVEALTAAGIDVNAPHALAVLYSKLMNTAGFVVVANIQHQENLHKLLQGRLNRDIAWPFWSSCQKKFRQYGQMLSRHPKFRKEKHLSYTQMAMHFRGNDFFKWCRILEPCQYSSGSISCISQGAPASYYSFKRNYLQTKAFRKTRIPNGWLYGSLKRGFAYAIIADKYLIISSHYYFLMSALKRRSNRAIQKAFPLMGAETIAQATISHWNIRKALQGFRSAMYRRAKNHYHYRYNRRRKQEKMLFKLLSLGQSGLLRTNASLRFQNGAYQLKGKIKTFPHSPFRILANNRISNLKAIFSEIPQENTLIVFTQNVTRAILEAATKLSRKVLPPAAIVLRNIGLLFGEKMNIVLNVKGRKQIRLLFQVQVSNTAFAKKMLLNLESILLRKRAKLKLTHYMGKQIRTLQNMRMLRHVSLSYVIHNKTLHLSLALKSSSAAFLQEVMNVSMGERKAFSQANSAKMINLSKKQHALFHIDFSNLRQLIKQQRRLRHDGRMILKWLSNKIGAAVEIAYINGSFQFQVKVK